MRETEVRTRLSVEDWTLVDITLAQFKLPTSDQWQGNKTDYILHMVKDAPDTALLDLAQRVGFNSSEAPKPGIDPPFWRKRMFRVFLSHLSAEKVSAAELQEALLPAFGRLAANSLPKSTLYSRALRESHFPIHCNSLVPRNARFSG